MILFGLENEDLYNGLFELNDLMLIMTFESGEESVTLNSTEISFQTLCGEETTDLYWFELN